MNTANRLQAIILAAGRGKRLKKLTEASPKCLNRIGNKTFLDYQVEALQAGGVTDVSIVTGYQARMLEEKGYPTFHNPRWEQTNMVSSLLCARDTFSRGTIVSYSDIIYPASLVSRLASGEGDLLVAYDPNWRALWEERFDNPLEDAESFRIDDDGRITDIGSPVDDIEKIQGQYMGLMKFTPEAFKWITEAVDEKILTGNEIDKMDMTSLLRFLIETRPGRIMGIPVTEPWCEIDTEKDLVVAEKIFKEQR